MLPKTSYQNSSSAFCSCSLINEIQLCILGGCDLIVLYGEKRPGITGRYVTEDAKGTLQCGSPGITLCSCGPCIVGLKAPYEGKRIPDGYLSGPVASSVTQGTPEIAFCECVPCSGGLRVPSEGKRITDECVTDDVEGLLRCG